MSNEEFLYLLFTFLSKIVFKVPFFQVNRKNDKISDIENFYNDLPEDHVQDLRLHLEDLLNNSPSIFSENQDNYTGKISNLKNKFEVNMFTTEMTIVITLTI